MLLHASGEAEAPARSYAELSLRARQMLMAFIVEVVENRLDPASLHWLRQRSLSLVVCWAVSPLAGKTTDWRAVCGKTARTVRREGAASTAPYPYQ